MTSTGARSLTAADTLLDSSQYHPRQMACLVQADSFANLPRADFFQITPLDAGWTWHPFEGVGGEYTYGLTRDSVQCEVTPREQSARTPHANGFRIFCYPD
jgi:hypothetical protein